MDLFMLNIVDIRGYGEENRVWWFFAFSFVVHN